MSRLETVFGAVCWHLLLFFQHDVEKILVFYGYIQIWWEIWQYLWPDCHDSQFAPLWTEIPLLETAGGCPNTVLTKDLNNPSQSKTKIRNWTKETSVTGKTHNGQKDMSILFSRYIYVIWFPQFHAFDMFVSTHLLFTYCCVETCWNTNLDAVKATVTPNRLPCRTGERFQGGIIHASYSKVQRGQGNCHQGGCILWNQARMHRLYNPGV